MAERRPAVMFAVLGAAVLAGGLVALYQSSRAGTGGGGGGGTRWAVLAVVGVVAVALLLVVVVTRARRGRPARTAVTAESAAARLGLSYVPKAESKYHARFGSLPGIPSGGEVRHLMMGAWNGRSLAVFQHAYHVQTGNAPIPVYHTVYITDAPRWPELTVTRRNVLSRVLYRLGRRRGLHLEDETFNATQSVLTHDEDFALTLLAPDVQAFLVDRPSIAWSIEPGRLAMVYNGALRPDRMDASLERLRAFWELLPAELEAWEPEAV